METTPVLDDSIRKQGIDALYALTLGSDPRTAYLVEPSELEMSEKQLAATLASAPEAWAAWLSDSTHANPLASLTAAIMSGRHAQLTELRSLNNELGIMLNSAVEDRASTRAIAREMAATWSNRQAIEHIDLRSAESRAAARSNA